MLEDLLCIQASYVLFTFKARTISFWCCVSSWSRCSYTYITKNTYCSSIINTSFYITSNECIIARIISTISKTSILFLYKSITTSMSACTRFLTVYRNFTSIAHTTIVMTAVIYVTVYTRHINYLLINILIYKEYGHI